MSIASNVRRPIEILYKRMNASSHFGLSYCTMPHKEICSAEFRENRNLFSSSYAYKNRTLGDSIRRYSAGISVSEQTSCIRQLRERTSAPIKDVKSALIDSNWDIGKAAKTVPFFFCFISSIFVSIFMALNLHRKHTDTEAAQKELRKRGVALASKKASRTATEGLLALAQNEKKAALIEINCETDFVARNEIFQYLALSLAKLALVAEGSQQCSGAVPLGSELLEELKMNFDHPKLNGEKTVQNAITEVAAMMGENVKIRRGFAMSLPSYGVMSTYLHASPQPGLGRIAGLLSLEVGDHNVSLDALHRVGSELAMHVVAAKPLFLTRELVSSDAIESEREILKSQAESTGKSQMAVDKMVEGRLRKYLEDVVLMEQKFIVNDTLNVKTLLSNLSKEVGSPVKIGSFFRIEVGEGLQGLETSSSPEDLARVA